ncbi:MAG TPA: DNA adenine methylase [bacterium]|nr:DNA adenine methylase [bacterium]
MTGLRVPYPWFGGKSRIVDLVWSRFGTVRNYVEPFFGGGAVLLGRPAPLSGPETINDINAYLSNFWRSTKHAPDLVAEYADWPVNEVDLEARHKWLVRMPEKREFVQRMKDDPDFYDPKYAGWWVWGICAWIGTGWCQGEWWGPGDELNRGSGINVGDPERGGKRPHLGNGKGINRIPNQLPHLGAGQGINRQTTESRTDHLIRYMRQLSDRFRNVRVCCGDWSRVLGPSVTFKHGMTGVFLDPPYSVEDRADVYGTEEDYGVARDVYAWCMTNGDNPLLRIALCGYEGEHDIPDTWECVAWKAHGGYGNRGTKKKATEYVNKHRERIWFSPACVRPESLLEEL